MGLDRSGQKYVSPSDTIMSPCTAKLNAYKSKHFMKWVFSFSFLVVVEYGSRMLMGGSS